MPVLARSHPLPSSARVVHDRFGAAALCHSHPRAIGESYINLYVTISRLTVSFLAQYMPAFTTAPAEQSRPKASQSSELAILSYLILITRIFALALRAARRFFPLRLCSSFLSLPFSTSSPHFSYFFSSCTDQPQHLWDLYLLVAY